MEIIPLTNDVMMKTLFGQNTEILKQFLYDMTAIPENSIDWIHIENAELLPNSGTRSYCLRLLLKTREQLINIEMQIISKRNELQHLLFDLASLSEKVTGATQSNQANRTILLCFLLFDVSQDNNYSHVYSFMEENTHEPLFPEICLQVFELNKVDDSFRHQDTQKLWLQLFKTKTAEELEILSHSNVESIANCAKILATLNKNANVKTIVKARRGNTSYSFEEINDMKERSRQEGIAEGIRKGKEEIMEKFKPLKSLFSGIDD